MKKLLVIYFFGWVWAVAQNPFNSVALVTDLLNSLSKSQKKTVSFDFDDPAKTRWHYLPHSSFKREGLSLSEMTQVQIKKTYALVEAYLSEAGYNQMEQIIDLENYLAVVENNPIVRDPNKYYIAIYGNPKKDRIWAWSFEGHHVSLNFTVNSNNISFAPAFWGSNPGIVPDGPEKGKIVLKKDHDLGLKLIQSLSSKQLNRALVSSQTYGEILTLNQSTVKFFLNNGILYKQLDGNQKKLLNEIIYLHLDRMEKDVSQKARNQLKSENWNDITFSWAGKMKKLTPHYYRIQGKSFLIEYDNSQNNANHIHVVWREFKGDFGRDLIGAHYYNELH